MAQDADYFLHPQSDAQRRYEALRAYFLQELPAAEAAQRYGYTRGSLHVLCTRFRKGKLELFPHVELRGRPRQPPTQELTQEVLQLRQRNLDIYEIEAELLKQGHTINSHKVWRILKDAGIPRLPKRSRTEESAKLPTTIADQNTLDLSPGRSFPCRAPLLLLFAPFLAHLDFDAMIRKAGYPGTRMIPATTAVRSLLTMKLLHESRRNHVMSIAEDEGLGLLAGLNVLPKTTKLHDYSYETKGKAHRALLTSFITMVHREGLLPTHSFNLDTHTIRHHGEEAILEKNYVPRRSQSTKSILAVYSQEFGSRTLVYGNADTLKREKEDALLRFVRFWKEVAGKQPEELVFDSRLTTQAGLVELQKLDIRFITLRSRHPKQVQRVEEVPAGKWKRARVEVPGRKFKNPRVLDERIKLKGYRGELRQVVAKDMGKEAPMFLLTNDKDATPSALLTRYALRTPIENAIGEQVKFFHVDALSSDVRLKVDSDVVLDVIASQCYHWFQSHLRGFERAQAERVWRSFLDRPGDVTIGEKEVVVRMRPFNLAPVLMDSPLVQQTGRVPWMGNRRVRVEFRR